MTKNEIDLMRPKEIYDQVLRLRALDGEKFYQQFNEKFIEIDCPACAGESVFLFVKYGFSHRRCEKCQTIYCSPRPTDDLLAIFYNEYESPRLWTKMLVKADNERKALQYKPRVNMIINKMIDDKRGGIALDIGAGSGAFSLALKNSGFFGEVIALDLSADCIDVCRKIGLDARQGAINEVETASVDFICMNDLIEHLVDLFVFLQDCFKALRPGGYLSIATPNCSGFDFQILKEQTRNITPPEHLNYFNVLSIKRLLSRAGFDVSSVETPGILDVDIIIREKTAGLQLKDNNEYLDYLLSQDEQVLKEFQKFLSDNKLSSHMLVMARKSSGEVKK